MEISPKNNLDIKQAKLKIEREKLTIERSKAKWTAFSVVVPLLAVIATAFYGLWSIQKQAELNFQLEAVKAIVNESDPDAALGRAKFYSSVFPDKFPAKFFQSVDASKFRTDPAAASKMEFLKLLSGKGLTISQTAELWRILYPGDEWSKQEDILEAVAKFSQESQLPTTNPR